MFCPKCGNQLPDGAQFCSSCGNPVNVQPAAPVMPAEPTIPTTPVTPVAPSIPEAPVVSSFVPEAPVVSTFTPEQPVAPEVPVMPAAPVVPETPVAPVSLNKAVAPEAPVVPEAPVMPEQPIMPAAPAFVPEQPAYNSMAMPVAPEANMATTPAKKSKAPLFIGLGIGALLIAIIAIVIILLVTGDDDDKKPTSGASKESTTSEEVTTETPTELPTDEPTTDYVVDVNYADATDVVKDFMDTFEFMDYDDCVAFLYPGMAQFLEESAGQSAEDTLDDYSWGFYDENGDFFDYVVKDAEEDNSDALQFYLDLGLGNCDDYDEPYAYAKCEVEFTYKNQTSSVIIRLAYTDYQFYIIDFDDEKFEIIVEEESTDEPSSENPTGGSDVPTTETIRATIEARLNDPSFNYTLVNDEYDGTIAAATGFTIKLPTGWTSEVDSFGLTYYIAPSGETKFTLISDQAFGTTDPVTFLTDFCQILMNSGYDVINLGNLTGSNSTGYYVAAGAELEDGTYQWMYTFMLKDSTSSTVHCMRMISTDVTSNEAYIAECVAYSMTVE